MKHRKACIYMINGVVSERFNLEFLYVLSQLFSLRSTSMFGRARELQSMGGYW